MLFLPRWRCVVKSIDMWHMAWSERVRIWKRLTRWHTECCWTAWLAIDYIWKINLTEGLFWYMVVYIYTRSPKCPPFPEQSYKRWDKLNADNFLVSRTYPGCTQAATLATDGLTTSHWPASPKQPSNPNPFQSKTKLEQIPFSGCYCSCSYQWPCSARGWLPLQVLLSPLRT